MFSESFILITLLYGISAYFHRHQGSHLVAIRDGKASLNPVLVRVMQGFNLTFLPWLLMLWVAFETVWYYPILIILISQIISFGLVFIETKFNLAKSAWLISLIGVLAIPLCLSAIILIVLSSHSLN
jgi:hypothetical protein